MKKLLCLTVVAILSLGTTGNAEKIRIGASVPLTGEASTYGVDIRNGLLFANKHIANDSYELIIEDDKCSDKQAATVAQKLVSIDKVDYVLGFGCSGALLAAAPIYERGKVVVIASATGAPAITNAGDYIFRTIPSLNVAAKRLYDHAAARYRKVGIVSEETAYCQGLAQAFTGENQDNKLTLVKEDYLPEDRDFRTIYAKLKAKGVEALFLNPQAEAGLVTMYKQLQGMKWNVPIYAAYYPSSPAFLDVFGAQADGIVFADLPFNNQVLNSDGLRLYKEYEKEFGPANSGEYNITLTYAAFNALHQAIQSKQDVKSHLYAGKFGGIIDGYEFDDNGDVQSDKITFVLKTIRSGEPQPVS